MEASSKTVIELIGRPDHIFCIPSYQRKYTWKEKKEIDTLLKDLEEYKKSNIKDYFLGSIIVKKNANLDSEFILVDGQQRITTVLIMLASLMDSIDDKKSSLWIEISNKLKTNNDKFKLNRIHDQDIIRLIITNKSQILNEEQKKSNYYLVYLHFLKYFNNLNEQAKEEYYNRIILNIKLAIINLDSHEDEYLVFESINSKGKNLSSADLIKNYIIMRLCESDEEAVLIFENEFLEGFKKEEEETILDFYRQMIAIESGKLLAKGSKDIYYQIKNKFLNKSLDLIYINNLIYNQKIWNYIHEEKFNYWTKPLLESNKLNFYAILHLIIKNNSKIENNNLIVDNKKIEFYLKFLSKLVVGRTLVSFGRVEGNRSFAKIANNLNEDLKENKDFRDSFTKKVINHLEDSSSNDRMPKWEEISNIESKRDLYTSHKTNLKWILLSIEQYLLKSNNEFINESKISIEHIFPQNPSDQWGKEAINNIKGWINTLGNLSITNHNSSLGNKTLEEKQKILEEKSYLKINKMIYECQNWDLEEIKQRAKKILNYINQIWFE